MAGPVRGSVLCSVEVPVELRKLIVGLDFNEPSYSAARWLVRHLGDLGRVVLVHVVHVPERPGFLAELLPPEDEFVQAATEAAEVRLRELGASLGADAIETVVRWGRPADEIVAAAEAGEADLIAVADRAQRVSGGSGVGSTAEQLLRTAPVPVFLARHLSDGPPRRILVPLDESPISERVMHWARLLAEPFGAAVIGFHTLSPGLFGSVAVGQRMANARDLEERLEERTRRWLRARLDAGGFDASWADVEVGFGDPAYEIVAAVRDSGADMVVMGSRGAGQIASSLLGSKATAVIRGTPVPILVVADRTA